MVLAFLSSTTALLLALSAFYRFMLKANVNPSWPIGALKTPSANRNGLKHKVISFMETSVKFHGYDDEVQFNTQCSSQWDCLCEPSP